jgi:hypothetical protein
MLAHIIYKKIGKSRSIKVLGMNFFALSGKTPLLQFDCRVMQ